MSARAAASPCKLETGSCVFMFVVVTEAAAARWAALTRAPQPTGRGVSSVMGDDTGVPVTSARCWWPSGYWKLLAE